MRERPVVLVIDDQQPAIDAIREALRDDYDVRVSTNGEMGLAIATRTPVPDLVLCDLSMPGMDGVEVCRQLQRDARTAEVPVMLMTDPGEGGDEARGFEAGATDFVGKPISRALLLRRVRIQLQLADRTRHLHELVYERTQELEETRLEVIRKLGRAAEYKNDAAGAGVQRMSEYVHRIAVAAGLPSDVALIMRNAAPMHDIGKLGIPDSILQKPGKLTPEEFEIMQGHTIIGADIIGVSDVALLATAREMALTHHEKWNGKGYPNGLRGESIPLAGRISAVADVFDALTSRRPHKEPWPVERAVALLEQESGTSFDPSLVPLFIDALPDILQVKFSHDALSELSELNLT